MKLSISHNQRLDSFDRVLVEYLGGEEAIEMLVNCHEDKWAIRDISEVHGVPSTTVFRTIVKARMRLRTVGLFPSHWEPKKSPVES